MMKMSGTWNSISYVNLTPAYNCYPYLQSDTIHGLLRMTYQTAWNDDKKPTVKTEFEGSQRNQACIN